MPMPPRSLGPVPVGAVRARPVVGTRRPNDMRMAPGRQSGRAMAVQGMPAARTPRLKHGGPVKGKKK